MVKLDYFKELRNLIPLKKHIILRTDFSNFILDCKEVLCFLARNFEVVVISFELNNINKNICKKPEDINRIHLVECALSDSFQEIEFSLYKSLESSNKKNAVIFFICPKNLTNKSIDETTIFFSGFVKRIESMKIPLITMIHTSTALSLIETISSNSYKIISVRKEKFLLDK